MCKKSEARCLTLSLLFALLVFGMGGAKVFASPLSDDFSGSQLDPKWHVTILGNAINQDHSVTLQNGQLHIIAGGSDIWDNNDNGLFLWQVAAGDFQISLKLISLSRSDDPNAQTDASAKVGIMVRQNLDNQGVNVFAISMNKGTHMQARIFPGANTGPTSGGRLGWRENEFPQDTLWLRLTRKGNLFIEELSTDGKTWGPAHAETHLFFDRTTVPMTDPVLVGIALTSHNSSATALAVVDDFTFTQLEGGLDPSLGFALVSATDANGLPLQKSLVQVTQNNQVIAQQNVSPAVFALKPGAYEILAGGVGFQAGKAQINVQQGQFAEATVKVGNPLPSLNLANSDGQGNPIDNPILGKASWKVFVPENGAEPLASQKLDPAKPDFDDSQWQDILAPGDAAGDVGTNTFFWYRLTFKIPADFPKTDLILGGFNIDDNDWTFFNGHLIGSTAGWNTIRNYPVPQSYVNWGGNNTIAILAYQGGGGAGFNLSAPTLRALSELESYVVINLSDANNQNVSNLNVKLIPDNSSLPTLNVYPGALPGQPAILSAGPLPPAPYNLQPNPAALAEPVNVKINLARGTIATLDQKVTVLAILDESGGKASPFDDDFKGASLDPKWKDEDLNTSGGSTTVSNGKLTVNADGTDIWGSRSGFRYLYQKVSGDFASWVRVESVPQTHEWAKAGLMVATSNDPGAVFADVIATRDHGIRIQARFHPNNGNVLLDRGVDGIQPPVWVKLRRVGTSVAGFYSSDGKTSILVGGVDLPNLGTGEVVAGIAQTSHQDGSVDAGTYSSFRLVPIAAAPPAPPAVVCGDANGDGRVAVADAILALQIAVGVRKATGDQMAALDLNGDGKVAIGEVILVLRKAVNPAFALTGKSCK